MRHNLLPRDKKNSLRVEYFMRLASVSAILLATVLVLGIVACVPAYVRVMSSISDISTAPDHAARADEEAQFKSAEATLAEMSHVLSMLRTVYAQPTVTDSINAVLDHKPDGITVTGMSYERTSSLFTIEGIATTRDALITYKRALESQQGIGGVTSPISNLAKNANLPFRLSFTMHSASSTHP